MGTLDGLLAGIVAEPLEEARWLILADWLEENDDPRRGELLRLHRRLLATCCEPDAHPDRAAWQARVAELLGAGVMPCVPRETVTLPGGAPMTFSFVPPGTFLMGGDAESANSDYHPVHPVTLTRGFWLGACPVTQSQWGAVVRSRPARQGAPDHPVERVSWGDCGLFCEGLSRVAGRVARLPTESEWEYACRAGTSTEYHSGDGEEALREVGWYSGNAGGVTHPVGQLAPNAWGLFDVHGNVFEWTADWRGTYPPSLVADPTGPPSVGVGKVIRGGNAKRVESAAGVEAANWHSAFYCRSWSRTSADSSSRRDFTGFRVALDLVGG
jgi:uncharacterized protein (TIGR02996 family)